MGGFWILTYLLLLANNMQTFGFFKVDVVTVAGTSVHAELPRLLDKLIEKY